MRHLCPASGQEPLPISDAGKKQHWAPVPAGQQPLCVFCGIRKIVIWDVKLLMYFLWYLVFVEHVRGERGGERGGVGTLPSSQARLEAFSSSKPGPALGCAVQTALGPAGKSCLSSIAELLQVEKSAKILKTKI